MESGRASACDRYARLATLRAGRRVGGVRGWDWWAPPTGTPPPSRRAEPPPQQRVVARAPNVSRAARRTPRRYADTRVNKWHFVVDHCCQVRYVPRLVLFITMITDMYAPLPAPNKTIVSPHIRLLFTTSDIWQLEQLANKTFCNGVLFSWKTFWIVYSCLSCVY